MQYTMYYEEQQKIDYDEYGKLKQQLLQKEENQMQCRTIICA